MGAGYCRPALVISSNCLSGLGAVAIVVSMTSRERHLPTDVPIPAPQEAGLSNENWAKVDDMKSVSIQRLEAHLGGIGPGTLSRVEEALRLILEI